MSRGAGALQRDILEVLSNEPANRMWWRKLKHRFPVEVRHKTFYRAVRSLVRMGRVRWYDGGSGFLYLEKLPYYRVGDTIAIADEELRELLRAASRQTRRAWLEEAARECIESMPEVVTYPASSKNGGLSDHQRYSSGTPSN